MNEGEKKGNWRAGGRKQIGKLPEENNVT